MGFVAFLATWNKYDDDDDVESQSNTNRIVSTT